LGGVRGVVERKEVLKKRSTQTKTRKNSGEDSFPKVARGVPHRICDRTRGVLGTEKKQSLNVKVREKEEELTQGRRVQKALYFCNTREQSENCVPVVETLGFRMPNSNNLTEDGIAFETSHGFGRTGE